MKLSITRLILSATVVALMLLPVLPAWASEERRLSELCRHDTSCCDVCAATELTGSSAARESRSLRTADQTTTDQSDVQTSSTMILAHAFAPSGPNAPPVSVLSAASPELAHHGQTPTTIAVAAAEAAGQVRFSNPQAEKLASAAREEVRTSSTTIVAVERSGSHSDAPTFSRTQSGTQDELATSSTMIVADHPADAPAFSAALAAAFEHDYEMRTSSTWVEADGA